MHDVMHYIHVIINFFIIGFREGFARVNAALGIIIALFAAYLMPAWNRVWAIVLGATIVHLLAEVMLPVLANHEQLRLPPNLLEVSYWRIALALYFGYLIIISVFFFIKTRLLPGGKSSKKH
ncbi:MAG TPA: hypothetical protein VN154_02695 [Rhizomicrobium sp.]|nr:hypothetical protein [Rhizomicrobium sp.]